MGILEINIFNKGYFFEDITRFVIGVRPNGD